MSNDVLDNQGLVFAIATNDPEPGINANDEERLNPGGLRLHDFELFAPMSEVSSFQFPKRTRDLFRSRLDGGSEENARLVLQLSGA